MRLRKDIAKIIARQLMLAASSREKKKLKKWREHSEDHERSYRILKRVWHLPDNNLKKTQKDQNNNVPYDDFFSRVKLMQSINPTVNWWKVAASISLLVALLSVLSQFLYLTDAKRVELVAKAGQQTEAVLPDGSKVWLNNCSRLVYEQNPGRRRHVKMEGEVFFNVSKDRTSPFYVDAGDFNIKVKGTQFNVRNYDDGLNAQATVNEGQVEVHAHGGHDISLRKGESVLFDKMSGDIQKKKADIYGSSAWRDGVLVFDKVCFRELITRLERWYNINIDYTPEDFNDIHYSGTIRNLRIDQVFDFIDMTVPIEVTMKENKIEISKKQSINP